MEALESIVNAIGSSGYFLTVATQMEKMENKCIRIIQDCEYKTDICS
jgi:hypothetical protein